MGSIIAAVAVLLIHMERNAVASMKPSTKRLGLVPTNAMIRSAMRLWSPHFSMVTARKKPPMKRKMSSFA